MSTNKPSTIITILLIIVLLLASGSTILNIIQRKQLKRYDREIPFITSNNKTIDTEQILNWVLDNDTKRLKKYIKKIKADDPELSKKIQRYINENEGNTNSSTSDSVSLIEETREKVVDGKKSENKFTEIIQNIEDKIEDIKPETPLFKSKVIRFKINQNNIYYTGDIVDGKANGVGKGVFDNGNVYEGEWVNNNIEGKGKEKLPDGTYYEGEFSNNVRDGKGTYLYKNNEKYVGQWENNVRDGEGILYDKKGKIKYKGEWKNDIFIY